MVIISKAHRKEVYSYLFKEGVMVVKKDPVLKNHNDVAVPNLHVMMLLNSLHSRNYVVEKFNWQWRYYTLNDEGIEYLRGALYLAPEELPLTMTKKASRGSVSFHIMYVYVFFFQKDDEKPGKGQGGKGGANRWNRE
jgi:small subunit ribosomal protein S10e